VQPLVLKYHSSNNGTCCVYYKSGRRLYCWQLSDAKLNRFELLTCSLDGEPSCRVKKDLVIITDAPKGDTAIDRELAAFLSWKEPLWDKVTRQEEREKREANV
jgi:hypothetical protein